MIKERFQELSAQLSALRQESEKTGNLQERRSLLKKMRLVLKEIDDLIRTQIEPHLIPSASNQTKVS
jgi:hypothetical protein